MKKRNFIISILALIAVSVSSFTLKTSEDIGVKLDEFQGVAVYANGVDYLQSHGRNYSKDGYYYGKKWQCVEFIKRYYYDKLNHKFPDLYGHAKDFWDLTAAHGKYNKKRDLTQYYNDNNEKPKVGDLMCFPFSGYGHVAIVSKVTDSSIEVIQQNIKGKTRDNYLLIFKDGKYSMTNGAKKPIGWLRKK